MARGTVGAAGFAGPEGAGGARRPRGRRFRAGRSAAAGWGPERSGTGGPAALGGSGGRAETLPAPARPGPAPPAGHDRGPGAAGEALTRSPRRGGRGVGAWPPAVAGALSPAGVGEGPRVCRRAAGRPSPPGPKGAARPQHARVACF